MKRQKIFSIALILGVLLWPMSFASTGKAQPQGRRLIADTGEIRLGPGQVLRITVNGQTGNDNLNVSFRRMYYVGSNNGGVWRSSVAAENTSAPLTLAASEAASTDISQAGFDGVRGVVIVRGYTGATTINAGALAQIISSTGEVVAIVGRWDDTDITH